MTSVGISHTKQLSPLERQLADTASRKVHLWPSFFIVMLAIPFIIDVGTLRMTANRFFLLFLFFPAVIGWMFGKAGLKRKADYYVIAFTIWTQIALIVDDGFNESIEAVGMQAIETLGAYFLGRTFVRTKFQYRAMCRSFLIVLTILLPFAFLEATLNRPLMIEITSKVWKTLAGVFTDRPGRLGLRRAQVSFEHPILFGLFASYGYGLCGYGMEKKKFGFMALARVIIPVANTFFSLSTGAFLAVGTQILFTAWEFITRTIAARWKILLGLVVAAYVTVDSLSNRSPFQVFVTYMTFDQATSYNRVLIWNFGTKQVWLTPYFGIGHTGDWVRPWWMHPSMDNFWLVQAVQHGVLAFVLIAVAIGYMLRDICIAKIKSPEILNMRLGWMFAMISMFVAICSVHLWNATYVFFMFMLGAGMWLADVNEDGTENSDSAPADKVDVPVKPRNFRPASPRAAQPDAARVSKRR